MAQAHKGLTTDGMAADILELGKGVYSDMILQSAIAPLK